MTDTTRKIKAIECRHATYCESRGEPKDLHVVKEIIHYDDGSIVPNLRFIYDYQRPYYITKKGRQNHKEFKEWEDIEALDRYECCQRDLAWRIAKNLGIYSQRPILRELCQTHFVYGADLTSTSHLKHMYRTKWPGVVTPASNAVFDTETDMVRDPKTGAVIAATISFKDRCFTAVQDWFLEGHVNAVERIEEITRSKFGDVIKARNLQFEIIVVRNEYEIIKKTIDKAHEWGPDFLSVWNIKFDMDKILAMCERERVNPAELMCDPSVPKASRFFKFKVGMANKKMASGKMLVFKPSQQWHTVHAPAKFQWVDAMCAYRQIRTGSPEEPSYSLDYMLKKHLNITKLKFPELEAAGVPEVVNARWHEVMQRDFPLHYIAYNRFDCISMEMLDEKILDMSIQLPLFSATTDLEKFNSQPRKIVNELSWFVEERGKIMGSTGSDLMHAHDEEVINGNGLIN